jgi:hypothetical protein
VAAAYETNLEKRKTSVPLFQAQIKYRTIQDQCHRNSKLKKFIQLELVGDRRRTRRLFVSKALAK